MQYLEKPTNPFQKTLDRIPIFGDVLRQPLGVIGFVIVLAFCISVIFAPLIAPYDYSRIFQIGWKVLLKHIGSAPII
jgi:ABC-type dipeptide/oligopeptide/nickel transport system permease subunit